MARRKWFPFTFWGLVGGALALLTIALSLLFARQPMASDVPVPPLSSAPSPVERTLEYRAYPVSTSTVESVVHTLLIPQGSQFQVVPAIAPGLDSLEAFAQREGAIAVLNGGFFDPANQQTTSYVTIAGDLVADPRSNERLMANPQLTPYLERILNRSEFRRYRCGAELGIRYDITVHTAPVPTGCDRGDALGAGPQLLPETTLYGEGFTDRETGPPTRDALGSRQPNARTAIGLKENGDILWAMAAQRPDAPGRSGVDLDGMARFLQSLGVVKALNLDGGSSSALYYEGTAIHGKVDASGEPVRRPVKSVLLVKAVPVPLE